MLDGMALGLLVSRAAAGDVAADDVEAFLDHQFLVLKERSREHPVPVDARLALARWPRTCSSFQSGAKHPRVPISG
jgi:hypothetical protein